MEIEGTMCQLERKISASHKQLEDMVKALLSPCGECSTLHVETGNEEEFTGQVIQRTLIFSKGKTSNSPNVDTIGLALASLTQNDITTKGTDGNKGVGDKLGGSKQAVDDFVKSVLHNDELVIGLEDVVKSTNIVICSGQSEDIHGEVQTKGMEDNDMHTIPATKEDAAKNNLGPQEVILVYLNPNFIQRCYQQCVLESKCLMYVHKGEEFEEGLLFLYLIYPM